MLRLLKYLKQLFSNRSEPVALLPAEQSTGLWCLVGNIVPIHACGVEKQIRNGTKHFSPGTKVYCFPAQWGDGYEMAIVIGIHRGSRQWVTVVMPTSQITNWRAKVVYKPAVIERLQRGYTDKKSGTHFGRIWQYREEVESWVAQLAHDQGNRS